MSSSYSKFLLWDISLGKYNVRETLFQPLTLQYVIDTPLDISFSFTGICLTYWLHHLRTIWVFLGGVPACICHFFCPSVCPFVCRAPYLRSCTSCNHNFWYIWVKWWHLQAFFFFIFYFFLFFYLFIFFFIFSKFWFFRSLRGERSKNSPKWKIKITSVTRSISETV